MSGKRVRVECPSCKWVGRRRERESRWWRNREAPTCPKCGYHPVKYQSRLADVPHV
jgi:hypothetical protein